MSHDLLITRQVDNTARKNIVRLNKKLIATADLTEDIILPPATIIEFCNQEEKLLIPLPKKHYSLFELRQKYNSYFFNKNKGWYYEHRFFRQEKLSAKYLVITNGILSDSIGLSFKKVQEKLSNQDYLPLSAVEIMWCLIVYRRACGENLLPHHFSFTSSISDTGNIVQIGFGLKQDENSIFYQKPERGRQFLGILPKLNFKI